jgi:hypothetical protein
MAYRNKKDAIKRLREKEKANPDITFLLVYDPYAEDGDKNLTPYYVISEYYYYLPENEGGPCFSDSVTIIDLD